MNLTGKEVEAGKYGGTYEGAFGGGNRAGEGKFVFAAPNEKVSYQGQWEGDLPSGKGVLKVSGGCGCGDIFQSSIQVQAGQVQQVGPVGCCAETRKNYDLLKNITKTPDLSTAPGGGFLIEHPNVPHTWPGGDWGEDKFKSPWFRNWVLQGLEEEAKKGSQLRKQLTHKVPSKVKIWVEKVRNMKRVDVFSANDPYVTCNLNKPHGPVLFRTRTIEDGGLNCEWNHGPEEHPFVDSSGHKLTAICFTCYEENEPPAMDANAGHCILYPYMFAKRGYDGEMPLYDPHGAHHGYLKIKIQPV